MLPDTFWSLTWADWIRLYESYLTRENYSWDRTRFLATTVVNGYFGRKKSITPKDLFTLPHDNIKTTIELPNKDDFRKITSKYVIN